MAPAHTIRSFCSPHQCSAFWVHEFLRIQVPRRALFISFTNTRALLYGASALNGHSVTEIQSLSGSKLTPIFWLDTATSAKITLPKSLDDHSCSDKLMFVVAVNPIARTGSVAESPYFTYDSWLSWYLGTPPGIIIATAIAIIAFGFISYVTWHGWLRHKWYEVFLQCFCDLWFSSVYLSYPMPLPSELDTYYTSVASRPYYGAVQHYLKARQKQVWFEGESSHCCCPAQYEISNLIIDHDTRTGGCYCTRIARTLDTGRVYAVTYRRTLWHRIRGCCSGSQIGKLLLYTTDSQHPILELFVPHSDSLFRKMVDHVLGWDTAVRVYSGPEAGYCVDCCPDPPTYDITSSRAVYSTGSCCYLTNTHMNAVSVYGVDEFRLINNACEPGAHIEFFVPGTTTSVFAAHIPRARAAWNTLKQVREARLLMWANGSAFVGSQLAPIVGFGISS